MTHAEVPVPGGFVVGASTYAAFVDETGLRAEARRAARRTRRGRHRRARAAVGRGAGDRARPRHAEVDPKGDLGRVRAGLRRRGRNVRGGALVGNRRGHRVGVVRRHERDLSEHQGRRLGRRRRAPVLGVAVRRAHRLLPRQARLQPDRHRHRRRRAATDPVDPLRGDVHDQSRQRSARRARDRKLVRVGRGRGVRQRVAGSLCRRQADAPHQGARHQEQGAGDRVTSGRRHRHA